ncbi:MFS transporter [Alteromonas lipolytica]|uniref:MFS transporter n=1 Tax=Alteromonas lipolytica TaxID=1856405 RepID=A0A1E8FJS8_9ALTE|nr:MFS transporter [Alteromonas lipolytica]OFI36182.1 MFS transporter [Alteromonas lipolytica]GGF78470.1 MFS transporter [Alteromonas lipolytica]
MNAIEVRAAITLAVVYVLRMLGLFMVMPVLAVAAKEFSDYSVMLVGVAIGGYGLTQAALQIPMGMLSDKWGRKPVILLGLSVFALGSIIAAMADSMVWLIVGRILQGAGAIAGAIMALATDVTREQQRAKVMAIIGIAIGFSFYIAVVIGPLIANAWGLAGVFWVTGVLALCCLPLVKWAVPDTAKQFNADTLPRREQVWQLFTSPDLWRLNVSVMLLHMMITLLFVQVPSTLVALDIALDEHWTMYLPVLLVSVFLLALMMRSSRGQTPRSMLLSAVVMLGVAFVLLPAVGHSVWLIGLGLTIFFTGFNYLEANFPALLSTIAPAGQKGTAMGIYASFQFFGAFLGGILSGAVTQLLGSQSAYYTGAAIAVVWCVIVAGIRAGEKLKRVALRLDSKVSPDKEQLESVAALPGVVESVFDAEQHQLYLKVNGAFDELGTRALIRQW